MENDEHGWRKASYSDANGGGCVEVGNGAQIVLVRDTTDRKGPALGFEPESWRKFMTRVRAENT